MPELPEVETIVRHLRKKILGKRIVDFTSKSDFPGKPDFPKLLRGKKIQSLDRIGKNILFNLSGGVCLAIHLMMTGRLLLDPPQNQKHDRFEMKLSGGTRLVFNDIRKFGRCRVFSGGRTSAKRRFDLDAGRDAMKIKFKEFKNLIGSKKKVIKNLLLDQREISGIGNIYADEILWFAGIHPLRKTESLKDSEIENLYKYMRQVLALAIKRGGTSSRDYRKPDGSKGDYYQIRKVYQRAGKPCSRDSVKIQKIVVGGRPTHFCPRHQR